jgi:hypothetical protein
MAIEEMSELTGRFSNMFPLQGLGARSGGGMFLQGYRGRSVPTSPSCSISLRLFLETTRMRSAEKLKAPGGAGF